MIAQPTVPVRITSPRISNISISLEMPITVIAAPTPSAASKPKPISIVLDSRPLNLWPRISMRLDNVA